MDKAVKQYLSQMASKGGKARAKKYDKETLSKWAKKGGRPPKRGQDQMRRRNEKDQRGYMRDGPGSGIWWVVMRMKRRIRREKVGNKGAAIKLYQKRKTEVLQGKKLPEQFRAKAVTFSELADDAIEWAKAHELTWQDDEIRLQPMP